MEIRPAKPADLDRWMDIDGTIASLGYLHVERAGEGLGMSWRLEQRPLRQKLIESNPLDDERRFALKQTLSGIEDGLALVVEHEETLIASLLAQPEPDRGTLRVVDLRVDFDYRRQGLGTAMLFRAIQEARQRELRAVMALTRTNNLPAGLLLLKAGFELTGLDLQLRSTHDLVKEAVTLFWYAALD